MILAILIALAVRVITDICLVRFRGLNVGSQMMFIK